MTPLPRRLTLIISLLLIAFALPALHAEDAAPAQKSRFIYLLRLAERLHTDAGWTKDDEEAIGRHFRHLKAATETGQAIVVGRTLEPGDKTFGLVIFEADSPEAAQAFAESDPAVVAGIMSVEVRPFALVLMRKM
jgi:uncharacterized protein YciI